MADISQQGHRKRVKETYVKNGLAGMADHNILELILFYAIPRKDTKALARDIYNHFGQDLGRVFSADIDDLKAVKGVGESAAILLSLFGEVEKALALKKNEAVKGFADFSETKEYCKNILSSQTIEKVIVITLDNNFKIIGTHTVAEGTVNTANIEPRKIIECAIKDNCSSVILSHNHPNGSFAPSQDDIRFTASLNKLLKTLDIKLADHIIVGADGSLSMKTDVRYTEAFL